MFTIEMKQGIFPHSIVSKMDQQLSFSLRRSLVPLHKLSYWSGTVLNWCAPTGPHHYYRSRRRSINFVIRCIIVAFFLLLSTYTTIVEFLELLFFLQTQPITFEKLIPYTINFAGRPVVLGAHLYFVIHRKKLLSFFCKWNQMELNYASLDRNYSVCRKSQTTSRVCTIMMSIYLMFSAFIFVGYIILVMGNEENSKIISSDEAKDTDKFFVKNQLKYYMTNWVYISIDFITIFPTLIILTMMDIVPTFVFYHGSNFLQILRDRFIQLGGLVNLRSNISSISNNSSGNKFDVEAKIHDIWFHYETLNQLINKANKIFGPLLILNHGLAFFDICSATVALFYSSNDNGNTLYTSVLIGFTLRLACSVLLMSKVRTSSNQLYSTVTTVQLRSWTLLSPKEHRILQSFLSQLQNDRLVASPCQLYKITSSILLAMLSLVITYTIVLIQSA